LGSLPNAVAWLFTPQVPFCQKGACLAILDSGSNIIAGPEEEVKVLNKNLNISLDCKNFKSLPNVEFILGQNDKTLTAVLTPTEYVRKLNVSKSYLAALQKQQEDFKKQEQGQTNQVELQKADSPPAQSGSSKGTFLNPKDEAEHKDWSDGDVDDESKRARSEMAVLQELFRAQPHIDIASFLAAKNDIQTDSDRKQTGSGNAGSDDKDDTASMCISLFSTMPFNADVEVWLLGLPFFQKYYTRFSWPFKVNGSDGVPGIHLEDRENAPACNGSNLKTNLAKNYRAVTKNISKLDPHTFSGSDGSASKTSFAEQQADSITENESPQPFEWTLADIRMPRTSLDFATI